MDYSTLQSVSAEPLASSMIETFRAIGYNLETAIADIIDNSVSASSKNVYVNFEWLGENSWISIRDDGRGMTDSEIIEAMRPGSKSPIETRDTNDLGRFGLGLKTASFSQCRKLTLISKVQNSTINFWTWDLDYVIETDKWDLIKIEPEKNHIETLFTSDSGTIVLWEDIDRLVKNTQVHNQKDIDNFLIAAESVKAHLAMVFHRFIEQKRIKLFFNNSEVAAWDPYLKGENATQPLPDEPLARGIKVKAYILPHISKITDKIHKQAEGPKGWNAQQGFYIYRNERMLVGGDWLGMFRKEEHYKLARIMIDIPNTLDVEWQIDIKKSVARPPSNIRQELKRIANYTRSEAVKIYRHRGKAIQRALGHEFAMLWIEKVKHGKRFYEVNRDHPIIKEIIKNNPDSKKQINSLLRLVEETVPVPLITLNESEKPDSILRPFEGSVGNELTELLKLMYESLLSNFSPEQAKQQLLFIEPFNEYPELIESL